MSNPEETPEKDWWDFVDPAKIASSLDALIDAAPEEVTIPDAEPAGRPVQMKGWDARHRHLSDPTGEKWLETFGLAKAVVKGTGLLALIGDRGTGKTQMASHIAADGQWPNDVGKWNGHRNVFDQTAQYVRAMDIFLDLRDANRKGSETSEKVVLAKLADVGLLVIDEFQERGESEWENRVLTNLIDKRYAAMRPTIIIANYDRAQLSSALSPSIKDRMHENGKSFMFDWPSYRRAAK